MTEMKAQLLTELPYHRIEQPRKSNKYLEFFGSYIALPLMTIILVLSLLVLFLLVKTYFSNSYMYALQDNLDSKNKNELDIGSIIDTRYDQFNNRIRPNNQQNLHLNKETGFNNNIGRMTKASSSLIEKALFNNVETKDRKLR